MTILKKSCSILLVAVFIIFMLPVQQLHAATNNVMQVHYLALGDSLAAGVTPDNEMGEGYTDMLAQEIMSINGLYSFNKGFAYPGYTTADVLSDIQENVEKKVVGFGNDLESTIQIQDAIQEADIITLSVGANDALGVVDVNRETGAVDVDLEELLAVLHQAKENIGTTIAEIKALNHEAEIYVMSYYNPFPHLPEAVQPQISQLVDQLNNSIHAALQDTDVHVIETKETVAKHAEMFLPNPDNIHLSTSGYQQVSTLFWEQMVHFPWIIEPTFSDVTENWAQLYVEQAANKNLIKGYTDSTFRPYNALTRVQAASILTRMLHLTADKEAPFKDIERLEDSIKDEINAAYAADLIHGFSNETFRPYDKVTRAQLSLMIKRAFEFVNEDELDIKMDHPFTDMETREQETQEAVSLLYQMNIANGSNGAFMPEKSTLRQQAAKIFVNTQQQIQEFPPN